jgi:hypothetical protein
VDGDSPGSTLPVEILGPTSDVRRSQRPVDIYRPASPPQDPSCDEQDNQPVRTTTAAIRRHVRFAFPKTTTVRHLDCVHEGWTHRSGRSPRLRSQPALLLRCHTPLSGARYSEFAFERPSLSLSPSRKSTGPTSVIQVVRPIWRKPQASGCTGSYLASSAVIPDTRRRVFSSLSALASRSRLSSWRPTTQSAVGQAAGAVGAGRAPPLTK